jgi:hypothetical protein
MWQLILGPILGLVGSGVEKFFELKTERLKAEERQKDRDHDLAVMDKEADLALKQVTVEGRIRQDEAAAKSFSDSYQFANDKLISDDAKMSRGQLNWIVAVEVISKAIRPLSTIWYQLLVAVVFGWSAWMLVRTGAQAFTAKEATAIFREVIFSIIGMAETTLFWWYGIRRMSKKRADA